jgi:WD40 repeat protein
MRCSFVATVLESQATQRADAPRSPSLKPALVPFLAVLLFVARTAAAEPIQAVDPTPDKPSDFYVDVYPVLEAKCLACHSRTTKEAELVLEDVAGILKGGSSGPAVVPNQPDQSLLFKVCSRAGDPAMPPLPNRVGATAVTSAELGRIKRWIAEGAQPGKMNPSAAAIGWQALPSTMKASFALAHGPQDRFVAVGRANSVAVYDLVTGTEVAQLGDPLIRTVKTPSLLPLYDRDVAHFDVVSSLAFSPDGDVIASGGYREIKIWQRQRNSVASRIGLGGAVKSASLGADGGKLVVVLGDNTVAVWDLESGEQSALLGQVEGAARGILLGDGSRVLIAKENGDLTLWSVADKKSLLTWSTGQPVTALAASKAGDRIVTGHADGSLRRWDLPAELPEKIEQPAATSEATGATVQLIAMKADGSVMTVGFAGGKVITVGVDLKPGKDVVQHANAAAVLAAAGESLLSVAAPEARRTAEVRLDPKAKEMALSAAPEVARRVQRLEDDRTVAQTQKGQADEAVKAAQKESDERAMAVTKAQEALKTANEALPKAQTAVDEKEAAIQKAKDELAAKADDEALKKALADAETAAKKPREELAAAKEAVTTAERNVRFSETAAQAAKSELGQRNSVLESRTAQFDRIEKDLAATKESLKQSDIQILAAALSADSKFIATGHSDGLIHLWAVEDGRWLETFSGHGQPVQWLSFANADSLVSIDKDGTAISWNLKPQWKLATVLGTHLENRLDVSESPLKDRVLTLQFSPDGRTLASGGGEPSRGGEVLFWDVSSMTVQREFRELHSDSVNTLAFSRDGKRLATGAADKFVKLTDVESGKFIRSLEGHTGHVLGLDWSPDGATLVSGGADGALKVWNTETGEQRKASSQPTQGQVTAVASVGLADQVAIATNKGACQLIDRSNGKVVRGFGGSSGYVYQIAVSADGKTVMAADEHGVLRVWKTADGAVVREFKP